MSFISFDSHKNIDETTSQGPALPVLSKDDQGLGGTRCQTICIRKGAEVGCRREAYRTFKASHETLLDEHHQLPPRVEKLERRAAANTDVNMVTRRVGRLRRKRPPE